MECDAAVVLIFRDDGRFLLIKRADQKEILGADTWRFQAGTGRETKAVRLPL